MKLIIPAGLPSKKNSLRPRAGGRGYYNDPAVTAAVDRFCWLLKERWRGKKPLEAAEIRAQFYVSDGRSDLDNKFTTLQDCLVKAGVLRNDSIKRVRRFMAEAFIVDGPERVVVELREAK